MGDLISRSFAIKLLRNYADLKFANGEPELSGGIFKAVSYIKNDNIPTAYDAEKVIQQLEEKISSYELCVEIAIKEIDKNPQNASTFEVCSLHNNRGYLNGLKRALEIVKSGCIDVGKKGERMSE